MVGVFSLLYDFKVIVMGLLTALVHEEFSQVSIALFPCDLVESHQRQFNTLMFGIAPLFTGFIAEQGIDKVRRTAGNVKECPLTCRLEMCYRSESRTPPESPPPNDWRLIRKRFSGSVFL